MNDGWEDVVREKIAELEIIASWASQVGYGDVRDYCRKAQSGLKEHLKIHVENHASPSVPAPSQT